MQQWNTPVLICIKRTFGEEEVAKSENPGPGFFKAHFSPVGINITSVLHHITVYKALCKVHPRRRCSGGGSTGDVNSHTPIVTLLGSVASLEA